MGTAQRRTGSSTAAPPALFPGPARRSFDNSQARAAASCVYFLRAHLKANMKKAGQGNTPERELKFIADRKTFKAALMLPLLGAATKDGTGRQLRSVYFDTDGGDLLRHGITLRVRREKGVYVIGVKTAAESDRGFFERRETEVKSPSAEPDLTLFDEAIADEIRKIVGEKTLAPRFGSSIRRSTRTVETPGAIIEAALDSGFLFAGERREPIREIELELKSGETAALFEFGLAVVDVLPVTLGFRSKAERAARLLWPGPPPVRATPPTFGAQTPMDEAIGGVLRNCLSQFTGNFPALESGDAIEAVHQMRVAMRRLRSALTLFSRLFPCPEFHALRADSRQIGVVLGVARDWDVFVEMVRSGPLARFADEPGFDKLLNAAQARASAGHAAVSLPTNDRAMTRFVLSLERCIARRKWRSGRPGGPSPVAGRAGRTHRRKKSGSASPQAAQARAAFWLAHAGVPPRAAHCAQAHALRDRVLRTPLSPVVGGRAVRPKDCGTPGPARSRSMTRWSCCASSRSSTTARTPSSPTPPGLWWGGLDAEASTTQPALRAAWRSMLKVHRYWRRDPEST